MKVGMSMAALALMVGTALPVGAGRVDSYLWKKRVLILFAQQDEPRVAAQRDLLTPYENELADRDMVVFAVIGNDRIEPIYGEPPSDSAAGALRSEFRVEVGAPFTALLIGKDGGVKWRENRPAEQRELFDLIDAMPMRRNERPSTPPA